MRIETLVILAIVGFLVFGYMKKDSKASNVTRTAQLPSNQQNANNDGGAARALIQEGGDIINNIIDNVFEYAENSTPPDTSADTF